MRGRENHFGRRSFARLLICVVLVMATAGSTAAARTAYRGAQVHSLQLWSVSSAQMNQELDALASAGANVVRVDVGWANLETPAKGQYYAPYLARLDAFVAGCQARGLRIIATVAATPAWASPGGQWNDAPTNVADYGDVARFLTARYGSNLAAVEAWNEPEINNNLIAPDLGATYAAMVKAFYLGAKQGNPGVAVLAGSLSYADVPFLSALYAHGIKGYYDGISVHPYADGADPANTTVTHSFVGGIEALHSAQLAAGDHTPIWVTEFGWPTGTSPGASSEQQSANYVRDAFALVDGLSYVAGATVYQLRDLANDPANPEDNFGLLHADFTPRPAYAAFKAAMQTAPASPPGPSTGTSQGSPPTGTGQGSPPIATGQGTPQTSTSQGSPKTGTSEGSSQTSTTQGSSRTGTSQGSSHTRRRQRGTAARSRVGQPRAGRRVQRCIVPRGAKSPNAARRVSTIVSLWMKRLRCSAGRHRACAPASMGAHGLQRLRSRLAALLRRACGPPRASRGAGAGLIPRYLRGRIARLLRQATCLC